MTDAHHLDKHRVRQSFERAAASYDQACALQREVAGRLLERLGWVRLAPRRVLDLGCGTGRLSADLLRRYPKAEIVSLDLAHAMVARARRHGRWRRRARGVVGDMESLPFVRASFDLVVSGLTLQWTNRPQQVFAELARVMAPGAALFFTSFGPDTLKELRAAWSAADGHTHTSRFVDLHDLGDALLGAGLADPVMDMEMFTLNYPDLGVLMRELKDMGAHNATAGRPRGLTGRARLAAVTAAYEARRGADGLPATYEVVYGHAWAPRAERQRLAADGSIQVPLSRLQPGRDRP